jgi:predicted HicB family RNase H-like nuclease
MLKRRLLPKPMEKSLNTWVAEVIENSIAIA